MPQDFTQIAKKIEPLHKPKLLIVGTYHFSNPGLDMVKADLDDHLAPKRQAEIEKLVDSLAKFKPTKIAVEAPYGKPGTNEAFNAWKSGSRSLSVNESEQIGFRLAKRLGHDGVYPIDSKLDLDFESVMKAAKPETLAKMQTMIAEVGKVMAGFKDHPVQANLRVLNDPVGARLDVGFYLHLAAITGDQAHPGADLAASWWKRNMLWLSNLTTVATDPNDRVLVICGSGHASLLKSLLRDSFDFEVVDAMPYLRD